jgi:hypothetical protein
MRLALPWLLPGSVLERNQIMVTRMLKSDVPVLNSNNPNLQMIIDMDRDASAPESDLSLSRTLVSASAKIR